MTNTCIYSVLQAPLSEGGAGIDLASLLAGGRWRLDGADPDAPDAADATDGHDGRNGHDGRDSVCRRLRIRPPPLVRSAHSRGEDTAAPKDTHIVVAVLFHKHRVTKSIVLKVLPAPRMAAPRVAAPPAPRSPPPLVRLGLPRRV